MLKLDGATVYLGSCLDILPTLADNSVDSVVTDPPYELAFMGKKWDASGIAFNVDVWRECLRVLKPGGHLLAFGGTRTWHRLAVAIEDAGFDIRDNLAWLYGSGFPKSMNIGKAIDKHFGVEGEVVGTWKPQGTARLVGGKNRDGIFTDPKNAELKGELNLTIPSSEYGKSWAGWGTALKPAFEPIVFARKPLSEKTVAANVLMWGTGAINVDATRIAAQDSFDGGAKGTSGFAEGYDGEGWVAGSELGRWPSNVFLDETTAEILNEQSGVSKSQRSNRGEMTASGSNEGWVRESHKGFSSVRGFEDSGGASRFFYISKANKRDRNEGIENNTHPTVKPTDLMRELIKLVTPPGGTVLDPFTGSGSTGKAAILEGNRFIGVELTEEYFPIIEGRIVWAIEQTIKEQGLF